MQELPVPGNGCGRVPHPELGCPLVIGCLFATRGHQWRYDRSEECREVLG